MENIKRRIVQHGCSSLTITLPSIWVKKFDLNKGDELDVDENGSSLIISTMGEIASSKKNVDTTDFGIFTKNNLTHLYQLGYDDIEIKFDDEQSLKEIKDRIPECIGFEIIDQKPNKIFIKIIAHTLESEFDILLRKAFLITKEMADEVLQAINKNDFDKLKELRHLEFMNNKFTMACVRILNKRGYKQAKKSLQIYDIIKQLERIADEYKHVCDILFKKKPQKEILELFKSVNEYYNTFYQMFYKFSSDLKETIYLGRKKLLEQGDSLLKKTTKEESLLIHYLLNIIDKTYDAAGEYFALML